ncbi:MAG: DUF5809 family protein [Halolamina sp.]
MHTEGRFEPETVADARAAYDAVGPAAQVVVRETTRAMEFDREEYDRRVTETVVETARDALFASLLAVTVGDRDAYERWREGYDGEVVEAGSDAVESVAWHAPPFADRAVAATFQSEPAAAKQTLRRQAFGRLYRPLFEGDGDGESDRDGADA